MDFHFEDSHNAIRELARRIIADRVSDSFLLEFAREGASYDEVLWRTLAEQGLLGVAVPEDVGGAGLGLIELCLLLEEVGRHVAPVPLYASLVLGGLPLARFGSAAQQQALLAPLATGDIKLSAAIAERAMSPALAGGVTALRSGAGWQLHGASAMVPDGAVADYILVPATLANATSVFVVPTNAAGVTLTAAAVGISGDRAAHLSLDQVTLGEEALLGSEGQGEEILAWLEQRANVGHCALQLGVTEEALRRTAAYVSERQQFGSPLGSFQALAMRMADGYIDVEAIRSTYWLALWRLSQGVDARAEVRAAKWWACDGAHRVVCTAQHLHGGMGADVDFPIHRFYLLAKQLSYSLGNGGQQLQQLGQLLAQDDSLGYQALQV